MVTSSSAKEKKASRITTACNPCRSRKQKCSGERPACEQCLEFNRVCAWPEQLKRGPAKGYIEALEHRLHETETILLTVLPHLSQSQLCSILPDRSSSSTRTTLEDGRPLYAPISPLRKRGVEYWKAFPLNSTENIRRWEHDCPNLRRSRSSASCHDRETMDSAKRLKRLGTSDIRDGDPLYDTSPTTTDPHDTVESNLSSAEEMQSGAAYHRYHHHSIDSSNPPEHLSPDRHLDNAQEPEMNAHGYYLVDNSSMSQLAFLKGGNYDQPPVSQELSSWDAAPPVKFQQQFLW